jgi:hypothetical protein
VEVADVDIDEVSAAMGADPTLVAVTDTLNNRVMLFRLRDASRLRCFGKRGSASGQFNHPLGISVIPSRFTPHDHCGWFAITEEDNRRVQVVTQTGQVVGIFKGDVANGLGPLCTFPAGITVCRSADGQAEILVADAFHQRVVAFALDGSTARVVCCAERQGAGELRCPTGLVVTEKGDLWVVETFEHRVCLLR